MPISTEHDVRTAVLDRLKEQTQSELKNDPISIKDETYYRTEKKGVTPDFLILIMILIVGCAMVLELHWIFNEIKEFRIEFMREFMDANFNMGLD